jgi:hypothetical protein
VGGKESRKGRGEHVLLRLAGVALFGRIPWFFRGPVLDDLSRDLARGGSPADEPEKELPDSDISEAERKAALRAEQRRRAERRARREG